MSKESNIYRGRYSEPVPTTNLQNDEEDFPEFVPFDEGAMPRAPAPAPAPVGPALSVQSVDMCQKLNKPSHYTTTYDTKNLVVRRGQEFVVRVTFNRPLAQGDDFQLEFLIGSDPSPSKSTLVAVTFGSRRGGPWSGRTVETQGPSVLLGITPTADAIVGKFRTYVAIVTGSGMKRTSRDANTDLYLLFNAWCPQDDVFLADEASRKEYVMSDYGVIFEGAVTAISKRNWMYGQFERGILDACIYILDASRMPIFNRGNIVQVVRMGSAMINSQDDNGVLVGNWSENFSMGTAPTAWTGSVKILLQYANTGVPVSFGQCWVFAGVFNTFLRCLGVPSRVITNYNSAHDNTGNLKTELIFKMDGTPDTSNTRDSIWNYHCWNEVFIRRPDLPAGLSGWQVVDATPQETSDGYFRCGPASVSTIKEGLLCHPFDSRFVFAEVNSDVVFYKRDRYGTLTPFWVDKTYVGQAIYTQAIGSTAPMDITHTYKYPEGSAEDKRTMTQADTYGCERDQSELPDTKLTVAITAELVSLGQDVNLAVDFQNKSGHSTTVKAHLTGSVIFYTGVISKSFKHQDFTVTVAANHTERVMFKIPAQEYMPHLGSQLSLQFIVTGQADGQSVSVIKVIKMQTPSLTVTVMGRPQVKQKMTVTVSFTNPFNFPLKGVNLAMEGSGLITHKTRHYSVIDPLASISWKESFFPRLVGPRQIVAVLDSSFLRQVRGKADIVISA